MATNITFDGYDLQREEITVTRIDDLGAPESEMNLFQRARDDYRLYTSRFYTQKTIAIEGHIHTTTVSGTQGLMDEVKQVLSREQKELIITRDSVGDRIWTATARNTEVVMERGDSDHARFSVEFECADPFASSSTTVSASWTQATQFENNSLTISGTYPARGILTMDVIAGTVGQVSFENTTISGSITATQTIPAGENIQIDLDQFQVTASGNQIDFSGIFPQFYTQYESPNNVLTTISGDGFDVVFTYTYTPQFL